MMSRVIESLQNGMNEGIHEINSSIDSMVSVDPEEVADKQAFAAAEAEVDAEQSRIDKINARLDEKVQTVQEKMSQVNQSFDQGVAKTKEKLQDVSKSQFMQAYRAMRMVYWGNMAGQYVANHPDWMNELKGFGKSAAAKLQEMGIADATEDMTETEQICARRNAMFGAPDEGIAADTAPTTEMLLNGAELPEMGLESLALEVSL